jgi:hypothetical protein
MFGLEHWMKQLSVLYSSDASWWLCTFGVCDSRRTDGVRGISVRLFN